MTFGTTNGRRVVLAVAASIGLAALAWAAFAKPSARVVYNASESVPVGWYGIDPPRSAGPLRVGSIVLTRLPTEPAAMAAQRGYLPAHIPLLKRIGAVSPQHVCVREGQVRIDGMPVAVVLRADRLGDSGDHRQYTTVKGLFCAAPQAERGFREIVAEMPRWTTTAPNR